MIDGHDAAAVLAAATPVLEGGGVVALATDTRYAVVADAFQPSAVGRLCAARQAGRTPLTVLIRSPRQLNGLADGASEEAERLIASYWPGPLTLLLPAAPGLTWDVGDSGGTVALRMPADQVALDLIQAVGPLASSGAHIQGHAAPTDIEGARSALGDGVDLYVDGGPVDAEASTVVDCTRGGAHVLRKGVVPAEAVAMVADGQLEWGAVPTAEDLVEARRRDET